MVTHGQDPSSSSRFLRFWGSVFATGDFDDDSGEYIAADIQLIQTWIRWWLSDASWRGFKKVQAMMNGFEDFIGCRVGFHDFGCRKNDLNLKKVNNNPAKLALKPCTGLPQFAVRNAYLAQATGMV